MTIPVIFIDSKLLVLREAGEMKMYSKPKRAGTGRHGDIESHIFFIYNGLTGVTERSLCSYILLEIYLS